MSEIRIGDRVKFLNEVGGGIVLSITGKKAIVETEDGFEMPVLLTFLVKSEKFWAMPESEETEHNETVTLETIKPIGLQEEAFLEKLDEAELVDNSEEQDASKIMIAWKRNSSSFKKNTYQVWLINDSSYRMLFLFSRTSAREVLVQGIRAGMLEEGTKILLGDFSEEEIKEISRLKLESLFYAKWKYKEKKPLLYESVIQDRIILDPTSYIPNEYFDENALIQEIMVESEPGIPNLLEKLVPENLHAKSIDEDTDRALRSQTSDLEEVDLHIEELVENHKMMTPGEILEIQMDRFYFALEGAIHHGTKRMVFIHGVGNGKLRYEIRKALESKYKKLKFQDASFKEYGYGATMVILK